MNSSSVNASIRAASRWIFCRLSTSMSRACLRNAVSSSAFCLSCGHRAGRGALWGQPAPPRPPARAPVPRPGSRTHQLPDLLQHPLVLGVGDVLPAVGARAVLEEQFQALDLLEGAVEADVAALAVLHGGLALPLELGRVALGLRRGRPGLGRLPGRGVRPRALPLGRRLRRPHLLLPPLPLAPRRLQLPQRPLQLPVPLRHPLLQLRLGRLERHHARPQEPGVGVRRVGHLELERGPGVGPRRGRGRGLGLGPGPGRGGGGGPAARRGRGRGRGLGDGAPGGGVGHRGGRGGARGGGGVRPLLDDVAEVDLAAQEVAQVGALGEVRVDRPVDAAHAEGAPSRLAHGVTLGGAGGGWAGIQ